MYYEMDFCPDCDGWGWKSMPGCTTMIRETCSQCRGEGWVPINIDFQETGKPIKDLREGHRLAPHIREQFKRSWKING